MTLKLIDEFRWITMEILRLHTSNQNIINCHRCHCRCRFFSQHLSINVVLIRFIFWWLEKTFKRKSLVIILEDKIIELNCRRRCPLVTIIGDDKLRSFEHRFIFDEKERHLDDLFDTIGCQQTDRQREEKRREEKRTANERTNGQLWQIILRSAFYCDMLSEKKSVRYDQQLNNSCRE